MDSIESLKAKIAELEKALGIANFKWVEYEQEYILPCFKLAEESGIDLRKLMISEQAGTNCVITLIKELQKRAKNVIPVADLPGTVPGGQEQVLCPIPSGQPPTPRPADAPNVGG